MPGVHLGMNKSSTLPSAALAACLIGAGAGTGAVMGGAIAGATPAPGFAPVSVTFTSANTGWALGRMSCASGTCLSLLKTTDGATTWAAQALPPSVLSAADKTGADLPTVGSGLNVRFADTKDGWIFGAVPTKVSGSYVLKAVVWSTHNSGATWHSVLPHGFNPSQGNILDLEAGGGRAYLLAQSGATVTFDSSSPSQDSWAAIAGLHLGLPAGGSNLSGAIVVNGTGGWVVEGNDRGTTGSARRVGGHWRPWSAPCANVGGTEAVPAALNSSELAAVCVMGGFASPLSKSAPKGATVGSSWLYLSSNGGTSFAAVSELGTNPTDQVGQVLAYPAPGTMLVSRGSYQAQHLAASYDGGHHWYDVYAGGNFTYLGFTTSWQGVSIVSGAHNQTAMIITHNTGHVWSKVSF